MYREAATLASSRCLVKNDACLVQELLLPLGDPVRMPIAPRADGIDRLLSFDRLPGDFESKRLPAHRFLIYVMSSKPLVLVQGTMSAGADLRSSSMKMDNRLSFAWFARCPAAIQSGSGADVSGRS